MLTKMVEGGRKVVVSPRPVEVVLSEDMGLQALLLPPIEDLAKIDALRGRGLSLKDSSAKEWALIHAAFSEDLKRELAKLSQYSKSPPFLYRLADLAQMSGDLEVESQYLHAANLQHSTSYGTRRIADNLASKGDNRAAEAMFEGLAPKNPGYANLRLAYFCVKRNDLDGALSQVEKAVAIDPEGFNARLFEGALWLAQSEYARAIRSFRVAERERPNSSTLHANLAIAYLQAGQIEKAMSALKKAVSFDPLNMNAVAILADVAFSMGKNEEAIPALRYFLKFEQNESTMWARFARGLYYMGASREALIALRHQASLTDDGWVWNNMGAAYWKIGDRQRAASAFGHAISKSYDENSKYKVLFATRGLCYLLVEEKQYARVKALVQSAISSDTENMAAKDRQLADLYMLGLHAMTMLGEEDEVQRRTDLLLLRRDLSLGLRAWLMASEISNQVVGQADRSLILNLLVAGEAMLPHLVGELLKYKHGLINNIAFAYAELGLLDQAQLMIDLISSAFHKEPYATATLGLIHFRRGNVDRGVTLYREAVQISKTPLDRNSIRQKLNLELGRHLIATEPVKARKLIEKVAEETQGVRRLNVVAKRLLASLR